MAAKSIVFSIVLAVLCFASRDVWAQSPTAFRPASADQRAIENAAFDWIAAFEAGDLPRLMQLYTADAYVALHGQPALRGREAVREYFASRIGQGTVDFRLDIERIEVAGRTAHLVSAYWFTLALPGKELYRDAGRSLLIYRKDRNGRWKIHVDIDQATPDVAFPVPGSARKARIP